MMYEKPKIGVFMRHSLLASPVFLILLMSFDTVSAQDVKTPPALVKTVNVDLSFRRIEGQVPFDVPLIFSGPVNDSVVAVRMVYREDRCERYCDYLRSRNVRSITECIANPKESNKSAWTRPDISLSGETKRFELPAFTYFKPGKDYCLVVDAQDKAKRNHKVYIGMRPEATLADHFDTDIGVGYALKPRTIIGLSTLHFYLTPLNKSADLGDELLGTRRQLLVRTSLFFGISPVVIYSWAEQGIENILGIGNIVYGIGFRSPLYSPWLKTGRIGRFFFLPMRVNLGFMRFAQDDANPVISEKRAKDAFFFSISYDLSIGSIIKPLIRLFPPLG